jgi:hypothetical protein
MDIERELAWLIAQQYRRRARQNVVLECKPNVAMLRERPNLKIVASRSCLSSQMQDEPARTLASVIPVKQFVSRNEF